MFMDIVKNRYSVRKYSSKQVDRKDIDKCVEAARLAPSACNSQPWSFLICDDRDRNKWICSRIFSGPYAMNSFAGEAPVMIFVKTERSIYTARMGGFFRGVQFSLVDIGIACEHFALQATELGMGTCWIGWFNEKALKREISLPPKEKIDIILSMGYPLENDIPLKNRKNIASIHQYI